VELDSKLFNLEKRLAKTKESSTSYYCENTTIN